MKKIAILAILLAACASPKGSSTSATPGHGAIGIQVIPNPVVARNLGANTYEFPFDVLVRETGGRGVTISRVSVDVYALGGIHVGNESYDPSQIQALGFPTNVPGNGELRYHFSPRKSVTDDRLFGGVTAEVKVDAYDDTGTPTVARTTVTVTK
jgi:hypothetical protein